MYGESRDCHAFEQSVTPALIAHRVATRRCGKRSPVTVTALTPAHHLLDHLLQLPPQTSRWNMAEHRSPRVNKALIANYQGQTVRLIAKLTTFKDDVAIVETSDGGEVQVKLLRDFSPSSTYLEIIGQVTNERTIKMAGYLNMGDDVDMKLANQVVQIWHDARFSNVF
ncbi:hypothetical protein GSI_00301 [Ganoderma sinense ZZ0214-1]|uniref:Replication factor A protein 3 n=1 Tax=Ganoderma sinense ZZ0214-1 TaxID=1077348 RepID=A0A2G8SS93_9APHY|nr:hypothetical protein GSI_00301 [Ganoderma sinense ZZ0214-1]